MPDEGPRSGSRHRLRLLIGDFDVRPVSNELVHGDVRLRVRPLLMQVLLRLAAAPGEVVPRQTLLDEVWPRRLVADEVLSRTVAELREALGDPAREARYIETIPKVGYRLIAPVRRVPDTEVVPPASSPTAAPTAPQRAATWWPSRMRPALAALAVLVAALLALLAMPGTRIDAALERQLAHAQSFSSEIEYQTGPRFSPDARRVAFALGDDRHSRIVLQEVATHARHVVTGDDASRFNPVFFPDGTRLALYRETAGDCGIVEHDLASGAERVLVGCTQHPLPRFDLSPDGRWLAFASRDSLHRGLRLLDVARGSTTTLTSPPVEDGGDVQPRFSPDGRELVFFRGQQGARGMWKLPLGAPGRAQQVGRLRGMTYGAAWLRNAGTVLVSADWLGFRALHSVDPATGQARIAGARGAQFPDVSARGDVAFESASYRANLALLSLARPAAAPALLWPSARYTTGPEFSPDGTRLAFTSNRDGSASLFVGAFDGEAVRLPLPTDRLFLDARWSADGKHLYALRTLPGQLDQQVEAVRIDARSGRVETLPALGTLVSELWEAEGGRALYFGTPEDGATRMRRAGLDALGAPEPLPLPRVAQFQLAGGRAAYVEAGHDDIVACELPAFACRTLPLARNAMAGWRLSARAVWYVDTPDATSIARYDLASGAITHIPARVGGLGNTIAVSPDESRLVFTQQDPPAIDLMLAPAAS